MPDATIKGVPSQSVLDDGLVNFTDSSSLENIRELALVRMSGFILASGFCDIDRLTSGRLGVRGVKVYIVQSPAAIIASDLIHSCGLEALSTVQAFASHVGRIIDVC